MHRQASRENVQMASSTQKQILLSKECYDGIVSQLASAPKKGIKIQFHGDNYKTKLWREGNKIMAKDDKEGIREVMWADTQKFKEEFVPKDTKGLLIHEFVKKGMDIDFATEMVVKLMVFLKNKTTREEITEAVNMINQVVCNLWEAKKQGKTVGLMMVRE